MSKNQWIVIGIVTALFAVAEYQEGIGMVFFGGIFGFAITYGIAYWINRRKSIPEEVKQQKQKEKEKRQKQRQINKQKKAQAKLELQKIKQKENEMKRQEKQAKRKEKEAEKKEQERIRNKHIQEFKQQQIEAHRPRCPKCGSTNLSILGQHKKSFSVGKAVVGGVLTGGVGTLAGFAGKKTKKVDYVCNNCGTTFIH